MNRTRLLLIGIIALLIAGVVSFRLYMNVRRSVQGARVQKVAVVAAARNLDVGTRIAETDLQMVGVATDQPVPEGTFRNANEVIGRGVLIPILKNELVLASKVASDKTSAGMPAVIPAGMRALSVKVNDVISVAGFVVPGTRVDVLMTANPPEARNAGDVTTTTVLQNIMVLAAGQQLQRDAEGKPQNVPVITLLVSPDDAERLTLASSEGRIQLALRNPLDLETKRPPDVRQAALFYRAEPAKVPVRLAAARPRVAPPAPPAVYSVEIIRGDKRDVSKF